MAPADGLEAARAIRSYLVELLGDADAAASTDERLAELLRAAQRGDPVADAVDAVLAERPATRNWAARFLECGYPPDLAEVRERSVPGGGPVTILSAPRFVCPQGDYSWWQRLPGEEPPVCPSDGATLVPG